MRRTMAKAAVHTALNLLFFTLVGTALLALTYELTRDTIRESEEAEMMKLVSQIAPASDYDNDLLKDSGQLAADPLLGTRDATPYYMGRLHGEINLIVFEAVAPDGYGGQIRLVISLYRDGRIAGVRVASHNETPGLGDYIDIAKSDWITCFNGLSANQPRERDWRVRKDGGRFEHTAGATVTPRAVVKAVHKALRYAEVHHDSLFNPPAASEETP